MAIVLLLLAFATQTLFNLYATSMVTAAVHDSARSVAGFRAAEGRCDATAAATAAFVEDLGAYGRAGHVTLEWECRDPVVVRVTVRGHHPSILPARMSALLPLTKIERTIEVRIEGPA